MSLRVKYHRVFYGWWIVGACFLISLCSGGFIILGFTAFFEPIGKDFGWSYAQISLAASLRGVEVGLLAPVMGLLVDRWGPRRLLFGGAILVGLSLVLLSRTTSLGMFYGTFALVAIGISGLSPTVMMTAVANWFRVKIGLATSIMACGISLGGLLVPVIVRLIDVYNWRTAMIILGVSMLVIGLPLSLLVRHKPEQYGYLPDGGQKNHLVPDKDQAAIGVYEADIGVKQALRSRAFWQIGLSLALLFPGLSALTLHVMPYLSSVGIARSTSSLVATAVPLISITGRLASGWLGDRFDKKRVATCFFALMGLGLLFFSYVSDETMWLLVPFVILFGVGIGINAPIRAALIGEYFGRTHFGAILGLMMGMVALGGIVGPLFAGWVFDKWGSYHFAWLTFTFFIFTAIAIMVTTPPARTKQPDP